MGRLALCAVTLAACAARGIEAQTATQRVTFRVTALSRVTVSADLSPMVISDAVAGAAPASVTTSGGSYAITTTERRQKITAALDASLPGGVTLELSMAAPPGASSSGLVALNTEASDVVTGIDAIAATALPMTYRLSATEPVFMPTAQTRLVTFTIVAAP